MIRAAVVLAALVLAGVAAAASAAPPNAADLESEIVCPVCETTLDQSNAPIALRMKAFIRARIAAGDSRQEIEDALVAQFGEGVLAKPPDGGFGALAWILPLAALLSGAIVVGVLVRRWSRQEPEQAADDEVLDPRLERLVDEELARFDGP